MAVSFAKKFTKQYNKLSDKQQQQFARRLRLFMVNQNQPLLRRHALKGKYAGYYSIDVAGDLRAILRHTFKDQVIFSLIVMHSQLY